MPKSDVNISNVSSSAMMHCSWPTPCTVDCSQSDAEAGPWEPVLHVPEDCSAQVDIMLHKTHASISRPTLLVVVPHNVLIVGVRVLCEVPLDDVLCFLCCETEQHVHLRAV